MANVGVINMKGETQEILGIAGVLDNDIVIELTSAERWNSFTFQTTTGVVDIDVSMGLEVFKPAIAFEDLHSLTPATRVIVSVAVKVYRFQGTFKTIRIRQNGATAAVGTVLICARTGRG